MVVYESATLSLAVVLQVLFANTQSTPNIGPMPDSQLPDHYETLQVSPRADRDSRAINCLHVAGWASAVADFSRPRNRFGDRAARNKREGLD